MFLAIATRSDIAYAVSYASQFLEEPKRNHWAIIKQIFKYIRSTKSLGIYYKVAERTGELEAFSDADYASDVTTQRSVSGIILRYSGGAVIWASRRQECVSLSTTEVEYVASTRIREIGDAPLKKALEHLGGWPAVMGTSWRPPSYPLEVLLGRLRGEYNMGVLLEQWVGPDDKNSSANILQASLPEADRQDASAMYRKLTLQELQREVPQLQWLVYLREFINTPIDEKEPIVIYAMPYFVQMGRIISRTGQRTLHNYILWRFVMSIMPHMIDEYQQKRIEFRKILVGILSERNRWSQCVEWTNKKLGMAVGALFIRENFNHESKETALEMIRTIREAFNELLIENHWMNDETRAVAKKKADSINERIGYPEFLKDSFELSEEYKMLNITENRFLENIFAVLKYDAHHNLQKLREPVDKNKWSTEPAVVNAFYNPNRNDIGTN
ncbi:PREDICTED: membrane metallo-endopeptidase-like 1 [Wasmannia auropunctata]|uniref:membrane metallo-endopeptidase-like 1 n=1 Tax=Wasmannia auropunctata TaxID=64793 RepID=UPI0005EE2251|nr:PREDICTED: membrane metallo-endopeptidase-like 1 [Wasmannia auropunctata]